jgi:hypothetical protein
MARSAIATIGNSRYRDHVEMLVFSLRNTGYRGEICVLTDDDDFYISGCTMHHMRFRDYGGKNLNDARWLQVDLDLPFRPGDRVMYLESDVVVLPGAPIDRLMQCDFGGSIVSHEGGWGHLVTHIVRFLGGVWDGNVYLGVPLVFKVCPKVREFFRKQRIFGFLPASIGFGNMIAYNLACHRYGPPETIVPRNKVIYWFDIEADKPEQALKRQNRLKRYKWFIHYGGQAHKRVAALEYEKLHQHPEVEYLPHIQPFDQFYL